LCKFYVCVFPGIESSSSLLYYISDPFNTLNPGNSGLIKKLTASDIKDKKYLLSEACRQLAKKYT